MKPTDLSQSASYGYASTSRSNFPKSPQNYKNSHTTNNQYRSSHDIEPQSTNSSSRDFLRSTMGVKKSKPMQDLFSSQSRPSDKNKQSDFSLRNTTGNLASLMKKFNFDQEYEKPSMSKKYSQEPNFKKDKINSTFTVESSSSGGRQNDRGAHKKYDDRIDRKYDEMKAESKTGSASGNTSSKIDSMLENMKKEREIKEEIRKLRQQRDSRANTNKGSSSSSSHQLNSTISYSSSSSGGSRYNKASDFTTSYKEKKNLQDTYDFKYSKTPTTDSNNQQSFDFSKKRDYEFLGSGVSNGIESDTKGYTTPQKQDVKYDFTKKKYESDTKVTSGDNKDSGNKTITASELQSKYSPKQFKYKSEWETTKKQNPELDSKKKTEKKKQKDDFAKYFGGVNKPSEKFDCLVSMKDFHLGKLLGEGKFGNVYQAVHKKSKSLYALKKVPKSVIKSHYMEDQFILQVKLQAFMNHENLLAMEGFFHDSENIYLILEYMEGGTLYSLLKNSKSKMLPPQEASKKLKEISKGLQYMHENGIAHRDIKPQNIVMSHGVCKLCDFGWSTICDERRKTYCGTFDYAAPQILEGTEYDMSVDLWCLGVLAYELLVGKAPFYHIKKEETKKKILNVINEMINALQVESEKITYPSTMPKDAVDFIERLLKKDPEERIKVEELLEHPFLVKA